MLFFNRPLPWVIFGMGLMAVLFMGGVFGGITSVQEADSIPPTRAWVNIATNDTDATTTPAWANATDYHDDLWIITDGSILVEVIKYTDGPE